MGTKMKKWDEFYTEWTVEDYYRHVEAVKGFAHRLMRFTPKGKRVLEVGFGSGQISIYFAQKGYRVTGIDLEEKQVERGYLLADKLKVHVNFYEHDIFYFPFICMPLSLSSSKSKYFYTSFSQGLLEHFQNKAIKEILKIQLSLAKVVGFSVPLKAFGHKSRGDERLKEFDFWLDFVKDYKILYSETYAKNTQGMVIFEERK